MASLVLALGAHAQAPAGSAAQINALLQDGKADAALTLAETHLKANPRDAQVRFLRGLILTEQGKTVEATTTFEALIQDFPELPEPYNNLAVIQAGQGRYEQAYALLQQALLAQPNYLTAYENLGDLHLSMAEQAYQKVLGLDAKNPRAQAKLAIARELNTRIRAVR